METIADWLALVPKVELHLHLEGAIPLSALWTLIRKYGGDPSVPSLPSLQDRMRYRDFPHFIDTWVWKNNFLRELDDFTLIAAEVARDLRAQNIRYVEAFYSPPDFRRHGLTPQGLTDVIRKGLSQVQGVEVALVADLVRDFGPRLAATTLEQVAEVRELGVVGIGIGGSEHAFPPAPFARVYERARSLGLRTSAHAGEAAGAASIWSALRDLQVDRIGHGTRAEEDPKLVDFLAARRIPLEMCPISNLRTGVVGSLAKHPVRRYFDRGLVVTVNTDDPKMFSTSLAEELRAMHNQLGFSFDELRTIILNGIRCAWLSEERKATLHATFVEDPAWDESPDRSEFS
jgi:adenosine deaminase